MDTTKLALQAAANLHHLGENPYPGRGIVVGLNETGQSLVQIYWIMGRSENSRNRVFVQDGDRVFTEAADPSKTKDPSLIIYNAMRATPVGFHVVSNGDQTDRVLGSANDPELLTGALRQCEYEPDAPNFTPRITAVCGWSGADNLFHSVQMSILRKSVWSGDCDRFFYEFGDLEPSFGHCLTTYMGDGNPLPAFRGEPLLMPLNGDIEEIAEKYWSALDQDNKVSLVVKFIPRHGPSQVHIINKLSKVA